jgi:hypothetical protein
MKSTPFNFELTNTNPEPTTYSLYVKGFFTWLAFTNSQISLKSGETRNFTLIGAPDLRVTPQVYSAQIMAESSFNTISHTVAIEVPDLSKPESRYEIHQVSFDEKGIRLLVYSQEPLTISVDLYKDGLKVDNFSSILDAGEAIFEKNIDFEVGNYTANITIMKGGNVIYLGEKHYEVPFVSQVKVYESTKDSYLWSVTTVRIVNSGKQIEKKSYELAAENFVEPFLSSSDYFVKTNIGGTIVNRWEFFVEAGQTKIFTYTYNYTYAFAIIFAAILCVAAIFLALRKEVVIKKTVSGSKGIKGEHEMKVYIEITNQRGQRINDISVEDYVQPLFRIKKEFSGVTPKGFYRRGDDIKIVWRIPRIEPKETRVFTYTIVPKVGLGGKYSFSLAKLSYRVGNFRRKVYSNDLYLGSEKKAVHK